jgi:hypothetical protein
MANKGVRINREGQEVCSVKGCGRPYCAMGLCRLHYERRKRALIGMRPRTDRKPKK